MQRVHRRHDISDRWKEFAKTHLPGLAGASPDFERLVTDASHIRAYPYATDAHCGNQDMRRTVENAFPGLKQ